MTPEECKENGGLGKFAIEVCKYCLDSKDCEIAREGFEKLEEKRQKEKEEKKRLAIKRLGGRAITKKDLICMYCQRNALKCKCKNKSEARFNLRVRNEMRKFF